MRRTGKQGLKQKNSLIKPIVWNIVMLSIAIVIASFVIGGAIVATQFLAVHPEFAKGLASENPTPTKDNAPIPKGEVRIIGQAGSNAYNPNPVMAKINDTVT